jgi:hypothetical protein
MKWLYELDGEGVGPVDAVELKSRAARGEIGPDTLVWREGTTQRVPAAKIRGLLPVADASDAGTPAVSVSQQSSAQTAPASRSRSGEALGAALAAASAVSAVAFRLNRGVWRMMHPQRYVLLVLSLLSGAVVLAAPMWLGSWLLSWLVVLIGCVGLLSSLGILIGDPRRPLPGYIQLFVLQLKGSVVVAWGLLYLIASKVPLIPAIDRLESWVFVIGIIDLFALLVALFGAFVMFRPLPEDDGE